MFPINITHPMKAMKEDVTFITIIRIRDCSRKCYHAASIMSKATTKVQHDATSNKNGETSIQEICFYYISDDHYSFICL